MQLPHVWFLTSDVAASWEVSGNVSLFRFSADCNRHFKADFEPQLMRLKSAVYWCKTRVCNLQDTFTFKVAMPPGLCRNQTHIHIASVAVLWVAANGFLANKVEMLGKKQKAKTCKLHSTKNRREKLLGSLNLLLLKGRTILKMFNFILNILKYI